MTHIELAQTKRAFDDMVAVNTGEFEREAAYQAALKLVSCIEPGPRCRHYRDRRGVVHTDLYGVLDAMERDVLGEAELKRAT